MPDMVLQIGGSTFEVACEEGQEQSLEYAARLLDIEAKRVTESVGRSTEKRMLLLSALMLADTMMDLEDKLRTTEERLRAADERTRIAEAKAAMLAANALKLETEANSIARQDVNALIEQNAQASDLLERVLGEIEALGQEISEAARP